MFGLDDIIVQVVGVMVALFVLTTAVRLFVVLGKIERTIDKANERARKQKEHEYASRDHSAKRSS